MSVARLKKSHFVVEASALWSKYIMTLEFDMSSHYRYYEARSFSTAQSQQLIN
jgi:hypothetical protein